MSKIITILLLGICSLCVLGITMDVNSVTDRIVENEESLSASMRNTLKSSNINEMYDVGDEEMSSELIRNIADNTNTDSAIDVYIYDSSSSYGFLDVKLESTFTHLNGSQDSRVIRKTLISEEIPDRQE